MRYILCIFIFFNFILVQILGQNLATLHPSTLLRMSEEGDSPLPEITLVFVVDQLAHHELQRLLPSLQGGIKFLHEHGINYTQAFQTHGAPVTGIGHAAIATGTLPNEHGIINNAWFTNNKKIKCDEDESPDAAVLRQ